MIKNWYKIRLRHVIDELLNLERNGVYYGAKKDILQVISEVNNLIYEMEKESEKESEKNKGVDNDID